MSISIHKEIPINVQTSNGHWTSTTSSLKGILKQIIVIAASNNTYFDFIIRDNNDFPIYWRNDIVGDFNEQVEIPVSGVHSLIISDATAQEIFRVYLAIQEI